MSSDANSFETEFLRLSAFQFAIFRRILTSRRVKDDDFESDHFVVGRLRRQTPSAKMPNTPSNQFGKMPNTPQINSATFGYSRCRT